MASNNNDNRSINNANNSNLSSMSTPTNDSLSSPRLPNDSPRRSARLSSNSPQLGSRSLIQSSLHRTVSGGIAGSLSPKLNIRKKNSLNNARGNLSNTVNQFLLNDDINNGNDNDYTTTTSYRLPSDQSDDDEMEVNNNNNNNNTAVQPIPLRLATRAEVLSYFDKQTDGYKCKHCDKVYRASQFSDSNLRKHLSSSIHKVSNVLFKSEINNVSNVNETTTTISTDRKKELIDAAVNCVVEDGLPFNIFRRSGMSNFLAKAVPGFVGPHRKTVRNRVAILYSTHMNQLRSLLSQFDSIALTTDMWKSSRQVHYISLTAHVFNHQFEAIPIVLSYRHVIGQHLSTCITKYIKYELHRLGIQPHQVISITTDNGSNVKKATSTREFGQPISCAAHNLNLVVKKGLCLWKEPKADRFPLQLDLNLDEWEDLGDDIDLSDELNDSDNSIDIIDELISEEEDISSDEDDKLIRRSGRSESEDDDVDIPLSSLTLNDNNLSQMDHFEVLNNVFRLMKKTRIIIKFMKNHSATNEYISKHIFSNFGVKNAGGLVLDMVIRWCSSFLLLERLIKCQDILNNMFAFPINLPGLNEEQKKRLKELALNQHEWELLEVIKFVLEPFFDSTTVLSGQTYPTMAASFYIFRVMSHFLQATTDNPPLVVALKECLRFWFNIQCKSKLPEGQMEIMMVAAFLDPTFYKKMNDNDRKAAKKLIFRKWNGTNVDGSTLPSSLTTTSTTTSTTAKTTKNKLNPLDKLAAVCGLTINSSTTSKKTMTLDEELCSYVKAAKSSDNFQEFWVEHHEQLPRLSKLVRRTNIIPATSISSEALFSVASFLNRKQRSSLSSKTLRHLLVLKNRHILDKLKQDY